MGELSPRGVPQPIDDEDLESDVRLRFERREAADQITERVDCRDDHRELSGRRHCRVPGQGHERTRPLHRSTRPSRTPT